MKRVFWNGVANYLGTMWGALLTLICIPLYLTFLGVEQYGLVAFYVTLQGAMFVLDLGLTTTLTRELSAHRATGRPASEMRDLVRTLELTYWLIGIALTGTLLAFSGTIAARWLNAETLSTDSLRRAVQLMAVCFGLVWPTNIYRGGLYGLQRHLLYNAVNAAFLTARIAGPIGIFLLTTPTVWAYFGFQVVATLGHVSVLSIALWKSLPASNVGPRFSLRVFRQTWRFGLGLSGVAIVTTLYHHCDKVVLTGLLTLSEFACYSLAWTLAAALNIFWSPVTTAVFPSLSEKVASGDTAGFAATFHSGCAVIAATVLPASAILALFPSEAVAAWTGNSAVAENTKEVLPILMAGAAIGALTVLPIMAQWAHRWTSLSFVTQLAALVLMVPVMLLLTRRYGTVGAASAWAGVRIAHAWLLMKFMYKRILQREKKQWYRDSVLRPLAVSLSVVWLARLLLPLPSGRVAVMAVLGCVWLVSTALTLVTIPGFATTSARVRRSLRASATTVP